MPQQDIVGYETAPLQTFGYVSTPTVPFSERDLSDLLLTARHTNARLGVTGKLIVLEDETDVVRFAQVIEGPPEGIALVLDRIRADPRHDDIQVILDGPAPYRRFGGWDMAIEALPVTHAEQAQAVLFG